MLRLVDLVHRSHGGRDPNVYRVLPGALSVHHLFLVRGCNLLIVKQSTKSRYHLCVDRRETRFEGPMEVFSKSIIPGHRSQCMACILHTPQFDLRTNDTDSACRTPAFPTIQAYRTMSSLSIMPHEVMLGSINRGTRGAKRF